MLALKTYKLGKLWTIVYDFPEINDILPMRNNNENDVYITIISRGSFRVHGDGWDMVSKAGDIIDWEAGKRHEFIALEPNSRCVNIVKA